jgi:hypothetical protein
MNYLVSEYRDVLRHYTELVETISEKFDTPELDGFDSVQSVLDMRDCLSGIEMMNARVTRLAERWKECGPRLDLPSRELVREYARASGAQAVRLQQLCDVQSEKVRKVHTRLGEQLKEVGNGRRLLETLKPPQNNFPKFIDSRC